MKEKRLRIVLGLVLVVGEAEQEKRHCTLAEGSTGRDEEKKFFVSRLFLAKERDEETRKKTKRS